MPSPITASRKILVKFHLPFGSCLSFVYAIDNSPLLDQNKHIVYSANLRVKVDTDSEWSNCCHTGADVTKKYISERSPA